MRLLTFLKNNLMTFAFGDLLRCNLRCSLNVHIRTLRFAPQLRLASHPNPKVLNCFIKSRRAMTLVEILIVVSVLGMLSLAMFNALSVGLRVWKKAQAVHIEEDIVIFFDKLTTDLHNVYLYSKINFEGDFHAFAFPAMVRIEVADANKEPVWDEQMGKIQYSYDVSRHAILRWQADYGQALRGTYDEPRVLMSGVKALRFHYLYITDEGEKWSDTILEGVIAGIDVEVVFEEAFRERVIRKSINIPLGM